MCILNRGSFFSNGDNSGKTDYQKLLPSLALSWQIAPELMAYASYAQGFDPEHLQKWLIQQSQQTRLLV